MEKIKYVCGNCMTVNAVPADALGKKVRCGECKSDLMDTHPVVLSDANFAAFASKNDLPVVVDFWAPWCGPCRMMAPVFESMAAQFAGRARFAKLDTQDNPAPPARFNITGIPTLIVFKRGEAAARISGAMDASSLTRWVSNAIS